MLRFSQQGSKNRGPFPGCAAVLRLLVAGCLATISVPLHAALEDDLGRNEVRILSAPFLLGSGVDPVSVRLPARLEWMGYERVRGQRPSEPGTFFWGDERFWIYRRAHRTQGGWRGASLLELRLDETGGVEGLFDSSGRALDWSEAYIEPVLLGVDLGRPRARTRAVALASLPDHVWRTVVAAEDARFFDHGGVDSRSVARALLANVRRGEVAQGGSTITQQLIKMRDLTPKRTLGRKASEALRALALEAEVDKEEILEAYLNAVYFGQIERVDVYGLGAAARAYFAKDAEDLDLHEATLLAGMIQSPNRLSPIRNPKAALDRRLYVLDRLEALGWIESERLAPLRTMTTTQVRVRVPVPEMSGALRTALRDALPRNVRARLEEGRGFVLETTLDPWLQASAEATLARAGRDRVQGALAAADASTGHLLALVGSTDSSGRDELDRTRRAVRQPGSTVKPFVVMEALERCGGEERLTLATRVLDRPVEIDLPSGPWRPSNTDDGFRGVVDVRETLTASLNVPTVRIARHCGFASVAQRFRRVGLPAGTERTPSFVLGAEEVSPRDLLRSMARLAPLARPRQPTILVRRASTPSGRILTARKRGPRTRYLASKGARVLVRRALADAARRAGLNQREGWGKTGTSSDRRDAWFAGGVGSIVAVVWLGRDDGRPTGLSGARSALPVWREWIDAAAPLAAIERSADYDAGVLEGLEARWIDEESGLVLREQRAGARKEWFLPRTVPPRKRWWRPGATAPAID